MISCESVMTRKKYCNFIIVQHETRMTYDIIHNVNENIIKYHRCNVSLNKYLMKYPTYWKSEKYSRIFPSSASNLPSNFLTAKHVRINGHADGWRLTENRATEETLFFFRRMTRHQLHSYIIQQFPGVYWSVFPRVTLARNSSRLMNISRVFQINVFSAYKYSNDLFFFETICTPLSNLCLCFVHNTNLRRNKSCKCHSLVSINM